MPPQSQDQNYGDAMKKILSQVAVVGALPDADLDFLTQLQSAIMQNLRDKASQQSAAMQQGANQAGAAGGFPGGPPGGAPGGAPPGQPAPQGAGGGPPGMPPGQGPMPGLVPSAPNMDEIRRMLGAQGAAQ